MFFSPHSSLSLSLLIWAFRVRYSCYEYEVTIFHFTMSNSVKQTKTTKMRTGRKLVGICGDAEKCGQFLWYFLHMHLAGREKEEEHVRETQFRLESRHLVVAERAGRSKTKHSHLHSVLQLVFIFFISIECHTFAIAIVHRMHIKCIN